jgi:subtilisin family serine protease
MKFLFFASTVVAASNSNVVDNQYIVRFRNDTDFRSAILHYVDYVKEKLESSQKDKFNIRTNRNIHTPPIQKPLPNVMFLYNFTDYKGMAFRIPKGFSFNCSELLNDMVESIEEDQFVNITAVQNPSPAWGLRRIGVRKLPLSNNYTYPDHAGVGTFAYVIDTGVKFTHSEFEGRVVNGPNYSSERGNSTDLNGHGTHVAGIIASKTYGVAKNATVVAVKVLDARGAGTVSGVIAGLNWAVNDARTRRNNGKLRAIANLSLSTNTSFSLDFAVRNAISGGLVVVVAAGNKNSTACEFSPAREKMALTVAASTILDQKASFSNWGDCVDIFAPGNSILSTYSRVGESDHSTALMSGTSMAAPHVAGAALLAMGSGNFFNASTVIDFVRNRSTTNVLTGNLHGSPNLLLFSQ